MFFFLLTLVLCINCSPMSASNLSLVNQRQDDSMLGANSKSDLNLTAAFSILDYYNISNNSLRIGFEVRVSLYNYLNISIIYA